MTGCVFKPSGTVEDVLFGATIDGVKDEVEESRAIVAAKESEIRRWSLECKGLLLPLCCLFISDDKAAAELMLHGDDVISPVTPSTYIRIP